MDDSQLSRRLEALSPPGIDDSRERAKLAARAQLLRPNTPPVGPRKAGVGRPRHPRRGRYIAAFGLGAAALIAFLVISASRGPSGEPSSAFGAELVRFANTSPLLLLEAPGWRVEYANEDSPKDGEIRFLHGAKPIPLEEITVENGVTTGMPPAVVRQRQAELSWRSGTLHEWVTDRAASAALSTTAPVLGTTARVFEYEGGRPGDEEVTALWEEDGRVLEFRAPVPDMATFERRLAALAHVDVTTWLRALPASVVKAANHEQVVAKMLAGIPLPPGFEASMIPSEGLDLDRYQLGAEVAGTVACGWFQRWASARREGDDAEVQAAVSALATAKNWPVLREMEQQGAYPQVLEEFAAAMPSGRWFGRPLEGDVDSGLGCTDKGIPLPGTPALSEER